MGKLILMNEMALTRITHGNILFLAETDIMSCSTAIVSENFVD